MPVDWRALRQPSAVGRVIHLAARARARKGTQQEEAEEEEEQQVSWSSQRSSRQGPAEAGAVLRQRLLKLGRMVAPAVMQRSSRLRVSSARGSRARGVLPRRAGTSSGACCEPDCHVQVWV
jgi:hypothetical protein